MDDPRLGTPLAVSLVLVAVDFLETFPKLLS